jgi:hypothetical protein
MNGLKELVEKALVDEEFRKKLLDNPQGTAQEYGLTISDRDADLLKNLKEEEVEEDLRNLDKRLSKLCTWVT